MEPAPSSHCSCTIVDETIVFCPLHAHAESLLEVCEFLCKFMNTVELAREKDQELVRELILPCVENAISAATNKSTKSI